MSEVRSLTVPGKAINTFDIPVLDGIRAVAFMLVFLARAGLSHLVPGGLGVTISLFLSGYLITTLLWIESRRNGTISLRDFYVKRAFRILQIAAGRTVLVPQQITGFRGALHS